ncbi:MAG: hypothetical protein U1E96_02575 [Azonexus sp.]
MRTSPWWRATARPPSRQRFTITVEQGHPQPVLNAVASQTLREGDRYALQLAGSVPGGYTW